MFSTIATCILTMTPGTASEPRLAFDDRGLRRTVGEAYSRALDNFLHINVLKTHEWQERSGLIANPPGTFMRAGGDYQDPWTRDASINSWNAASLLAPDLARNTLWAVCERRPDGKIAVQNDNQWWDKIIWVVAAWNHYATTGDRAFLARAFETGELLAREQLGLRYDKEFGLFQGPGHMQDGIAGYPEPYDDPPGSSGFVLDYPGTDKLMTLSVNSLYYQAFRDLASMAKALKQKPEVAKEWNKQADDLRVAINKRLWMPKQGSYAYFLFGEGELRGKQAEFQDATGLSLAVLFGIPDSRRARQVVRNMRVSPYGVPLVDPHFRRYSDEKPGRHERVVWPMVQGYWAHAAAKTGEIERFRFEVEALVDLAKSTNWNFYEIYNATTGKVDGGWQIGFQWGSCSHQTWSATALVRMIHHGLFGMSFTPSGLSFAPTLPKEWGTVTLKGLRYRESTLDIRLTGAGREVAEFSLDGQAQTKPLLPAGLKGAHRVEIRLTE